MNLADYAKHRMEDEDDEDESDDKDEIYRTIGKLVCKAIRLTMKVEAYGDKEAEESDDSESE